jgi:PAS domain S-box-containing protein
VLDRHPNRSLLWPLLAVAGLVAYVAPQSGAALGGSPSFMPAMLSLVGGLDLISAVLLVSAFRFSGDRRALVLASSYVFSLVVVIGFSASFPGILGVVGPLGAWPSTAPWLWVTWHTGFPVLLAAAVAPWPRAWTAPAAPSARPGAVVVTLGAAVLLGGLAVLTAVGGSGWLPVLIHGLDTTRLTQLTGPVTLPVVAVATLVAVHGAMRLDGPIRWACLASAAVLGDVVLTLFSLHRFGLGWYVGRSLTVVSSTVVLVAMLAEFSLFRARLAEKAERLQDLLSTSEQLEELHSTLLNLMSDGVMLWGPEGRIIAANPAAETLLGLTPDQLYGKAPMPSDWGVVRTDGSRCEADDLPAIITLTTGVPQRDQILGVPHADGGRRWLRVNTDATGDPVDGQVPYVVTSMTDETARHAAHLTAQSARESTRARIQSVLDADGPSIVVQPIVDLRTGIVVGGEALARFGALPEQGPDAWFADAAAVGLGADLELAAVRRALAALPALPDSSYLSVNVSPMTAVNPALLDLLGHIDVDGNRLVLELTEHTTVTDYPSLLTSLARVRALGVRIAVDDAGAGFASLSHILNLRPDIVKLDIALVRNIHNDPARRALAAGLLIFAAEIGACLVAEGIETEDELTALRDVGVTHGQGYYLGRPAAVVLPLPVPRPSTMPRSHLSVRP